MTRETYAGADCALLGLLLVGCTPNTTTATREVVFEDVGSLRSMSDTFTPGAPVELSVSLMNCPEACATNLRASCSVELEGTTLRVSARGSYTVAVGATDCTLACKPLDATCRSAPLPAGQYVVEYADGSTTLQVPSVGQRVVIEPEKSG